MEEDPIKGIKSALYDLNEALDFLSRKKYREVEENIQAAIRKLLIALSPQL